MAPILVYATAADVAAAVRANLATELGRIDAAITTRLATASYTAPDNESITAIKAKTDALPVTPAAAGEYTAAIAAIPTTPLLTADTRLNNLDAAVSSRLATAGYTAPANSTIAAIDARLPSDPADQSAVEVAIAAIAAAPTAAANATAVRTELGVELGRIDAAVSSRLATVGYTAPNNAGIAALPTLAELEAAKLSVNAIEMNGAAIVGTGTSTDKWRGA